MEYLWNAQAGIWCSGVWLEVETASPACPWRRPTVPCKELERVTQCFGTDLQRGIGDRQPCSSVYLGLQLSKCSNCLLNSYSFIQGDPPRGFPSLNSRFPWKSRSVGKFRLAFVLCDVLPFSGALDTLWKADPKVKDLRKGFALSMC